jgi:hypothetical protein
MADKVKTTCFSPGMDKLIASRRATISGDPELLFICCRLRRRDCWVWMFDGLLTIMHEGAD